MPVYQLLGKNLNFCPTPGKYKEKIFEKETNDFFRRIKLKGYFGNSKADKNSEDYIFKPHSNWEPKQVRHTINTFCEALSCEMKKPTVQKRLCNNLTKQEKAAMEELKLRDDLVITKADKGGAVVIMDVDDYVKEANRQLDDSTFYKKLPQDPNSNPRGTH